MFKRYYLVLLAVILSGIGVGIKPYVSLTAPAILDVLSSILFAAWLGVEVVNLSSSNKNASKVLDMVAVFFDATVGVTQPLKLIPPMQPDKNGKFTKEQNIVGVIISVLYSLMWISNITYLNTQNKSSKDEIPGDNIADEMEDVPEHTDDSTEESHVIMMMDEEELERLPLIYHSPISRNLPNTLTENKEKIDNNRNYGTNEMVYRQRASNIW